MLHGSSRLNTIKHIDEIEGISSIINKVLSKTEGYFRYKKNGRIIHLNTRYIPEFKWYLLVEQTEEKATRKILNALLITRVPEKV
ncbi:MAG: hypothetical protein KAH62_07385 [Desulfobacula sp.]|nr:hypothetical protein [Desulfobacula sp.]